jgi:hypothetical protein
MNTSSKILPMACGVLAAGGFAWTTKMAVIAASDGATSGIADPVTAVLWITGVALMAFGTAAVAVGLLRRRHPLLRVLGAAGGLVLWAVTYTVVESIAMAVVTEGTGPVWLHEEIGILATGVLLMTVGLLGYRASSGLAGVDAAALESRGARSA